MNDNEHTRRWRRVTLRARLQNALRKDRPGISRHDEPALTINYDALRTRR